MELTKSHLYAILEILNYAEGVGRGLSPEDFNLRGEEYTHVNSLPFDCTHCTYKRGLLKVVLTPGSTGVNVLYMENLCSHLEGVELRTLYTWKEVEP